MKQIKKEVIRIIKQIEMKRIKTNNSTWFPIISRIMLNTDESKQINYLAKIWKVNSKQIIICFFIGQCRIVQKTCKNGSKITKNAPKGPLFISIWHYLTLKKVFVSLTKRMGWPVLTQFGYRIAKWIPNIFKLYF